MTATPSKISQRKTSQAGNVFFLLFAAVGMVGLLGASISYIMRGPVASMAEVTKRNMAENNMIASSRLAVIMSPSLIPTNGDCDGDGFVEPLPFRDAGALPKPVGGGYLPNNMGASLTDPWGTQYGYCVWNHGPVVAEATTACDTASPARLNGGPLATYTSIAVISAGKNRGFETTCNAFVDVAPADTVPDTALVQKGATTDDYVLAYTYNEADSTVGGIWKIKLADTTTAEIAKNLEIKNTGGTVIASVNNTTGAGSFPRIKTDFLESLTPAVNIEMISNLNLGSSFFTLGIDPFLYEYDPPTKDGLNTFLGRLAGNRTMTGGGSSAESSYNTGVGASALQSLTTGSFNTAIGFRALRTNTTGSHNIAMGNDALRSNTTGFYNIGLGLDSLYSNTVGSQNTALGINALEANVSGNYNVALGNDALRSNTTGSNNISLGQDSLYSNTTGQQNIAFGINALRSNTDGDLNIAMGNDALRSNTTGLYSIAMGNDSLYSNTAGSQNIAFGVYTLRSNTTGSYNIAMGNDALRLNTTGSNNISLGQDSLYSNTTGLQNIASGVYALRSNTTGSYNIAMGNDALRLNTTGSNNISLGQDSLYSNTTGLQNIAFGVYALRSNTTGSYNIAMGNDALRSNTTGFYNIGLGLDSLYSNTVGSQNMAFGINALQANVSGNFNVALGNDALQSNTAGSNNISLGQDSLYSNTTGQQNIAFGVYALRLNTTGFGNTAMGNSAGRYITGGVTPNETSSNSIYIGVNAQAGADGNNNEIVIGNSAAGNGSNTVTLGHTTITKTILRGNVGINETDPQTALDVGGTIRWSSGTLNTNLTNTYIDSEAGNSLTLRTNPGAGAVDRLRITVGGDIGIGGIAPLHPLHHSSGARLTAAGVWTDASDKRLKDNIKPLEYGLDEILLLSPTQYTMKNGGEKQIGFIAQDVQKILPELVSGVEGDVKKGETLGMSYGQMSAVIVNAIKEIMTKIDDIFEKITKIFDEITALKAENTELKSKLLNLEDRIKALEEKETNAAKTP